MSRAIFGCGLLMCFFWIGLAGLSLADGWTLPTNPAASRTVDETRFVEGLKARDVAVRRQTLAFLYKGPSLKPLLIREVIGRLTDSDEEVREAAVSILDREGKRAVLPLARALKGDREDARLA